MTAVTKSIGVSGRDYSTITLWEADLDDGGTYAAGDDAIGQCYDDAPFDESFSITNGGTIGLNSITLTVADGQRHSGVAGSGARVVNHGNSCNTPVFPTVIEWLEIDGNGVSGTGLRITRDSSYVPANYIVRNLLVHHMGSNSVETGQGIYSNGDYSALNNIVYAIGRRNTGANTIGIGVISNRDCFSANNTVHDIQHYGPHTNGDAYCYQMSNRSGTTLRNCLGTAASSSDGSASDFMPVPSATVDHNASSDASAAGSGSIANVVTADQYVSTTLGSEDLHLKDGSDAIGAGVDLGTTPDGIESDIDGRDRDAEGDTWSIGADQYVSAGGGNFNAFLASQSTVVLSNA